MAFIALLLKFLGRISPRLAVLFAWPLFCTPLGKRKSSSAEKNKLAAQAQRTFIDSGTYKIATYKWTSAQPSPEGLTILLAHGWAAESFDFSDMIKELLPLGHTIVAYDAPAHGSSTGSRTTLNDNAKALLEVAGKLGPVDVLIGHSFGTITSAFALSLALHKDVLSQVKKLILISGPNKLVDLVHTFTQAMNLPEAVVKIFHEKIENIVKRPIETMSVTAFLKDYSGQTLVIHDRKDRIIAYQEAEIIASNVNAELFSTYGSGHLRILKTPSVIEEILKFIKSTS